MTLSELGMMAEVVVVCDIGGSGSEGGGGGGGDG